MSFQLPRKQIVQKFLFRIRFIHIEASLPPVSPEEFVEMNFILRLLMKPANRLIHEGDHTFAPVVTENTFNEADRTAFGAERVNHHERRCEFLVLLIDIVKDIGHMILECTRQDVKRRIRYRWLFSQKSIQVVRTFLI